MSNINISLFLISEYSVEREFFFVLGLQTGFVLRSEKNFSMTQAITDRVLTDMSSSSRLGY